MEMKVSSFHFHFFSMFSMFSFLCITCITMTINRAEYYYTDHHDDPDEWMSACANGHHEEKNKYGFPCPQMMLLSKEWIEVAEQSGFSSKDMIFGIAGSHHDDECGKCYQIQVLDAEQVWRDDFPFLLVQIFNSGYDVYPLHFDIFMGGGGFGYFTACSPDCRERYCQGGPCHESMYSWNVSNSFDAWVDAEYKDPNPCYSGGLKWLSQDHHDDPNLLETKCSQIAPKGSRTFESCVRTNQEKWHQNFVSFRAARVQCPLPFIEFTGLQRQDDVDFPHPSVDLVLPLSCTGDRTQGHYCVTTMQDCCKPSCSWTKKGNPTDSFSFFRFCNQDEQIMSF